MSSLMIDILIWILLIIGAGFGFIGLIGLLLFPDTRSRMYTSIRATLIGICSVGLTAIIYGMYALQNFGGDLYFTLILHTLILVGIVALGNYVISRIIVEKSQPPVINPIPKKNNKGANKK